jgi:hypothetical protein
VGKWRYRHGQIDRQGLQLGPYDKPEKPTISGVSHGNNRNKSSASDGKKALWIAVVLLLPVLGVIIWYLMGPGRPD